MHNNNIVLFKSYQSLLANYKINALNKYYLENTIIRLKKNKNKHILRIKKKKKIFKPVFGAKFKRVYRRKLRNIKKKKKI